MRHMTMRKAVGLVVFAAIAVGVFTPAAAFAAYPTPSLVLSTPYQPIAKTFTAGGYVGPTFAGKKVAIYIKKPNRDHWQIASTRTVNSAGRYDFSYTPKLAGRFYIRAKLLTPTPMRSRIASLFVAKGPSVKTQLLVSSTTSTRDSGLFEALLPRFRQDCPEYELMARFVGSGQAITDGRTGAADVLLTHSPAAEISFMDPSTATTAQPFVGKTRYKVMYNDFVLVGPSANPASVDASGTGADAFKAISKTGSTFWSRNDNSGTNTKEKDMWALIGDPQIKTASPVTYKPWYKASGTMGMAAALAAANNATTGGYTLSDRGTWLSMNSLGQVDNLKIVNQGDSVYFNQYSVIEVKGAKNWEGAQDFSIWIRSAPVQEIIREYGKATYGTALFVPNAGSY